MNIIKILLGSLLTLIQVAPIYLSGCKNTTNWQWIFVDYCCNFSLFHLPDFWTEHIKSGS